MTDCGRCLCGYFGPLAQVEVHQVACPVFASAYQDDPDGVPSPAAELERWLVRDKSAEKAAAHAAAVADTDARRGAMASRFATVDILDEE